MAQYDWRDTLDSLLGDAIRRDTLGLSDYIPDETKHNLIGLFGNVLRGGTLGLSDYASNRLKSDSEDFDRRHPGASLLANILGTVGGSMIGSTEGALAARGALLAGKYGAQGARILSKLSPTRVADFLGKYVTPAAFKDGLIPRAISSGLQGAAYTYNTAPTDAQDAGSSAITSGLISAAVAPGLGKVIPAVTSFIPTAANNARSAITRTLSATGLSPEALQAELSKLKGVAARAYDANPVALGSGGMLGNIARVYPNLTPTIRNNAAQDIEKIVNDSQGLTERHLGPSLPTHLSDYKNTASNIRSQAADPLYDVSRDTPVDLSSHPDLLNHYVLNDDFKNYLTNQLGNRSDPSRVVRINRFLDNRDSVVNAGDELLQGVKDTPISDADLHNLYGNTINNHIAQNNLDLSLPTSVVQDYIDHVAANRPPISQQYTRLTNNPVNDASRLADTTSRSVQEVSPEFAAAQRTYRELSPPLNQADLARNLTQMGDTGSKGVVDELDSEVTREFIDRNNQLREAAKAANLPDNSRPLTRYVLDEAINKVVQRNPQAYPKAILDTINNQVEPRLNAVFGQEPVSNLINEAQTNSKLINNRTGLASIGAPSDGDAGKIIDHKVLTDTMNKASDIARRAFSTQRDKALANLLQSTPEDAIDAIQSYLSQNPTARLNRYKNALQSATANIIGQAATPMSTHTEPMLTLPTIPEIRSRLATEQAQQNNNNPNVTPTRGYINGFVLPHISEIPEILKRQEEAERARAAARGQGR